MGLLYGLVFALMVGGVILGLRAGNKDFALICIACAGWANFIITRSAWHEDRLKRGEPLP